MEKRTTNRYVWNKLCPEWGPGVVVKEVGNKTEVLFEKAGRKKLSNTVAILEEIDESEISPESPLRDKLRWREVETQKEFTASFDAMIDEFTKLYPEGFTDPQYIEIEREYKDSAVKQAKNLLSLEYLGDLLKNAKYEEIYKNSKALVGKTNLVFRFEQIKFSSLPESSYEDFSKILLDLLHSANDYPAKLESFGDFLSNYGAGKWTIASYFGFIHDPKHNAFVKPMAVQHAAKALHLDIQYDSHPNAITYRNLLRLYKKVEEGLLETGLHPRDMIDIQGFLWIGSGMHKER